MQTVSRTLFHHFKLDYPSSKQKTKQIKQNQTNPTQRLVQKKKIEFDKFIFHLFISKTNY